MNLSSRRAVAMLIPLLWLIVLASAAGAIFVKHRARELFVELETRGKRSVATLVERRHRQPVARRWRLE